MSKKTAPVANTTRLVSLLRQRLLEACAEASKKDFEIAQANATARVQKYFSGLKGPVSRYYELNKDGDIRMKNKYQQAFTRLKETDIKRESYHTKEIGWVTLSERQSKRYHGALKSLQRLELKILTAANSDEVNALVADFQRHYNCA